MGGISSRPGPPEKISDRGTECFSKSVFHPLVENCSDSGASVGVGVFGAGSNVGVEIGIGQGVGVGSCLLAPPMHETNARAISAISTSAVRYD